MRHPLRKLIENLWQHPCPFLSGSYNVSFLVLLFFCRAILNTFLSPSTICKHGWGNRRCTSLTVLKLVSVGGPSSCLLVFFFTGIKPISLFQVASLWRGPVDFLSSQSLCVWYLLSWDNGLPFCPFFRMLLDMVLVWGRTSGRVLCFTVWAEFASAAKDEASFVGG